MALLLVILGLLIFAASASRRVVRLRNQEPACATCGYRVRGLTRPICPECGSHVLEVGVIGRGRLRLRDVGLEVAALLCAVIILASIALSMMRSVGPYVALYSQSASFQDTARLYRFELEAVASQVTWNSQLLSMPVTTVELHYLPANADEHVIALDVTELGLQIGSRPPRPAVVESVKHRTQIASWLTTLPDVPAAHVDDHAALLGFAVSVAGDSDALTAFNDERIRKSLEHQQALPSLVFSGGGGGGGTILHPAVAETVMLVFFVLWAVWTIVRLLRWRRLRVLDRSGATWDQLRE